ncbi:MAG: outer membrane protein assembly factor BamA [Desulfatitalea sp.]|nr:outer membrane protein assembly factor BamA [Desulfatitalea sp.]NNK01996.1 outer membrane protein assembly factor BamA [Desulfatitalea sp.]
MSKKKMKPASAMRIWLPLLLMAFAASAAPHALAVQDVETPRILVLPFQVISQTDASYLSTQIAQVVAQRLSRQGAQAFTAKPEDLDAAKRISESSPEQIIAFAQKSYDAAFAVWGDFTLTDGDFSLDVRLMEIAGASPQRFSAKGSGIENLVTVANDVADQIGKTLFKHELVAHVEVKGNQRIEADAILRVVKTKSGSAYNPSALTEDLRAIYAMGYFDDLRVEAQADPDGRRVTFHVQEKPTIRHIRIRGNSKVKEEDINDNLTLNTGAILNIYKIRSNMDQIETLYKEKNYHKVKVDYEIKPLENNQADLDFIIEEGPKLYVTRIRFEGNHAFEEKKLKKMLDVNEKGFFSWLTSSGDLDRAALEQDMAKLNAFYSNQGYMNARVGDPIVQIGDEGIQITFKIEEGQRFKIGRTDIEGDLIFPKDDLLSKLKIIEETYFNREVIRNDILALNDRYADQGYAYSDISPRIVPHEDDLTVDIIYVARKGPQVYFEKIIIQGNTNTRDKVIRRELHVREQGLFSNSALKRSIRNLYRLEYFEDVKVDTLKGGKEDKMVLKIDVTEKSTNSFTFGAGYSSAEDVFFTGSISQRNLFGRGQILNFEGSIGGSTTVFSLKFTEPHFLDTQWRTYIEAYNLERTYSNNGYERKSTGGGLGLGHPVWDYTYFNWGYNLDQSDVIVTERALISESVRELEGTNLTSSVNLSLSYDSRNRGFNATEGSKHTAYFEYAGLGGNIGFNKYIGQTMWYYPLYKSLVGFVNAKAGYVHPNDDGKLLPDYEKFYLGGINSLRGFGYQGVDLTEMKAIFNENGDTVTIPVKVGGNKMVQFNLELNFPLVSQAGLFGVVFYDTGNVYADRIDLSDLRESAGAGIRWMSPFAPIRLEYGHILDRREGESSGRWEFSMGGSF